MNEAIKGYIDEIKQPWQVEICQKLDTMLTEAIPDAQSRLQYKKPHYLKNGKYAAVFSTAKGWVSLTIFNAAALQLPTGLFEASDNQERITIKITEGQAVDYAVLAGLVKQAASGL